MKKHLFLIPVFFLAINTVHSQTAVSPVSQLDDAVKALALDIHKKLVEVHAQKVILGQFSYRGSVPPFATYWTNQLTEELTNMQGRAYVILSTGTPGADRTISGEIVEVTNIIRVYNRLISSEDRSIEAAFHSDFERNAAINTMLVSGGGGGSSSSSSAQDEYEVDSWEYPVSYEIGLGENAPLMNRTITEGDEDFFLLIPERDGRLTMETTGNIDTYMTFYNYDTGDELDEDDDGGSGSNARIRYNVRAGTRYLAEVRGYGRSTTGSYGFRAYMTPPREGANSWDNPLSYEPGIDEGSATLMNRSLQDHGDEDFFLIVPANNGRLTMETTGHNMDTYMYLYNYDTRELLDEDDDGAQDYNARIRYNVQAGRRYLVKVTGYDGETGTYNFRAYLSVPVVLTPDEYEPDDDPSQAKLIEIGRPQQHNFHHADDVDWVKFQISQPGRYVIRARGVNSNSLDTYIELYDSNLNLIAEDDDGGTSYDSRLALHLESGLYYLKVWCLDDEPNQPYTISIITD
ncbi:MAG: hypothetical protein LBH97_07220 [Treponema sp.]|jgi:hypothetical protein|nr:hypothetical protein [Treponema sp.]